VKIEIEKRKIKKVGVGRGESTMKVGQEVLLEKLEEGWKR